MTNEIVIRMTDDISATMRDIANSGRGLNKQMEQLQRQAQQLGTRYEELNRTSAKYKTEADSVKREMEELKKTIAQGGDGAVEAERQYQRLEERYNTLQDAAKSYRNSARDTMRDMNDVARAARNLHEGNFFTNFFGEGFGSQLASAGIFQTMGSSLSGAASAAMGSALGQPLAETIGQTLSGAVSGAAAGAIAGLPGAVVGGAVGALSGGITAMTSQLQTKDEAIKSYTGNLYDTVNANTTEALTSGKTLAAQRETTKLSFTTLLGGEDEADAFLDDVLQTANTTPFLYDDLVGISKTLLSFGTAVEDVIPTLTTVGDAGAAKGLNTSDIGAITTYLGRMKSSNKTSLEYLNPIMERGFGEVFQWLADAKGTSISGIYDMISKGKLSGTDTVDIILGKFNELYAGQMEVQSHSTEGLASTLEGLQQNIQNAMGEGYNRVHNESVQADIDAYGGALGEALQGLNQVVGENKAYMENLQSQYQREALSAVLLGDKTSIYSDADMEKLEKLRSDYLEAQKEYAAGNQEAGLKMENLKEQAEALATAAYESSDAYQQVQNAEIEQMDAIKALTGSLDAATNELKVSNARSKGMMSVYVRSIGENAAGMSKEDIVGTASSLSEDASISDIRHAFGGGSHAFGLRSVPFDNYLALLHQGERVQTAEEVRRSENSSPQIVITGNSFTVRSDADVDAIAAKLADELEARAFAFGG